MQCPWWLGTRMAGAASPKGSHPPALPVPGAVSLATEPPVCPGSPGQLLQKRQGLLSKPWSCWGVGSLTLWENPPERRQSPSIHAPPGVPSGYLTVLSGSEPESAVGSAQPWCSPCPPAPFPPTPHRHLTLSCDQGSLCDCGRGKLGFTESPPGEGDTVQRETSCPRPSRYSQRWRKLPLPTHQLRL